MTELEFGERLKQYRKQKGLTQQELADLLGVSNKSVSRWESGSYPDVATLGPLAKALGVTVDDLLGTAPPIRTLGKSDWQSLLSFAFTIGGGVLYFLLVLFTPVPVAYLLYLGAMAYGVYLQKHYTYHSRWFLWANLAMDFFVNCSVVWTLIATLGVVALPHLSHLLATALFSLPYSYSSTVVALYLVYLLLSAGLTALTVHLVHKYFGAGGIPPLSSLKAERAKMNWRKWVPVGLMALVGAYWGAYRVPRAVLPEDFYLLQDDLYGLMLLGCVIVCILLFNWKGRRGMLLPSLGLVGACALLPGLLDWNSGLVYSTANHELLWVSQERAYLYHRVGTPTWALFLALIVFTLVYILCCHIRIRRPNITSV